MEQSAHVSPLRSLAEACGVKMVAYCRPGDTVTSCYTLVGEQLSISIPQYYVSEQVDDLDSPLVSHWCSVSDRQPGDFLHLVTLAKLERGPTPPEAEIDAMEK